MDFLMLFSNHERIVIEVDGKHHYANGDVASPQRYAEMVAADRELRLAGYEIYRYGGYELQGNAGKDSAEKFFHKLLRKHGRLTK
jgi:very-short-patch-repair endonuclease